MWACSKTGARLVMVGSGSVSVCGRVVRQGLGWWLVVVCVWACSKTGARLVMVGSASVCGRVVRQGLGW